MAKPTSSYVCQQCGHETPKWMGKCPNCEEWGSLVETTRFTKEPKSTKSGVKRPSSSLKPIILPSIKVTKTSHTPTKIPELDRALGGGLVAGQVILLAGEPGIGKSTILMQLAQTMGKTLYISGEESVSQIAIRAKRLGATRSTIEILEETDVDSIISLFNTDESKNAQTLIIDSIQTMTTDDLSGMAGSVGQVKECAARLVRLAKTTGVTVIIVGHVTKTGSVAGPAALMHIVDTVLWFEGDRDISIRMLRARKNRFGPTDEVGIFTMDDKGLKSSSSEKLFLTGRRKAIPGSMVTSVLEGTRPILVEIESLTVPSKLAFPKRVVHGLDTKKVEMILAILARRAGVRANESDVYVNVAGGMKIKDPGADLAIALSIASAHLGKPLPLKTLAIGELSLLGEVRPASSEAKKIKEAKRLGFTTAISSSNFKYISQAIKILK